MASHSIYLPAKRSLSTSSTDFSLMSDPNSYPSINGTSNKRSKPPHTSLDVPSGHVAFRLLCHASRIGGVIGKSGTVIKQLQQETGAKIRIEDAPDESPDRVVLVVAPSAVGGSKSIRRGDEIMEVSKAQEALLRVFDRILEVAAESQGIGVGLMKVVSCRLLADAAQVGSVIGRGGKVVEKIRKETGSKIRVLTDNLPACSASDDEMVEIEGDIMAVKKALVAVSRCLQDCPPVDKIRVTGSRALEAHDTLPDLRMDNLFHRNLVLPTYPSTSITMPSGSINYASGLHSLPTESERIPTLQTRIQQQDVVFKILCENDRVGGIIGKGGSIIKALQTETGATVSVGASVAEHDERLITITASENPESRYSPAQKAVVLVFSRTVEAGIEKGLDSSSNKGSSVTARLVVSTDQAGCLLGKGGAIISDMRKTTGASIRILSGGQVPKCASKKDEVVQISGDFPSVQDALYNITGRLRDNLFSSILSNIGNRSTSSLLTDVSPYGRMRDPVALGINSSPPPLGVSPSLNRHAITQSFDHIGLSRSFEHPASPRAWAPQTMVAGASTRGFTDMGRSYTALKGTSELGSGSKTAIVTNTTVEIIVPENVIGSVYGENGTNLTRLRQISGAKVIVHEPRRGSSDRILVISGTPDETQAAQSLLHAFILTGSS